MADLIEQPNPAALLDADIPGTSIAMWSSIAQLSRHRTEELRQFFHPIRRNQARIRSSSRSISDCGDPESWPSGTVEPNEIASMMLELQAQGCHNINFVSPSHVVAQILAAVNIAAERGLRLPLVYNTAGYDSLEALALLDGVIDIYMPDMKYGDSQVARSCSKARNYVEVNQTAVKEMHRQVGDLVLDKKGLARRGLLVRHLILPENLAGTDKVLAFIAREISQNTYLNVMDQYRPCYRADECPALDRSITASEYRAALAVAKKYELRRIDRV